MQVPAHTFETAAQAGLLALLAPLVTGFIQKVKGRLQCRQGASLWQPYRDLGIAGKSYAGAGGVAEVLPVDVFIPGCPPRPKAIIFGILLAVGRMAERAAARSADGQGTEQL